MLLKYKPEDRAAKRECSLKRAQAEAEGKPVNAKKPIVVKYGLDHVTYPIEENKAQIQLSWWFGSLLCAGRWRSHTCIVKEKACLGTIVHKKTASVLCLTSLKIEDTMEFSKILEAVKANFNDKYEGYRKKWGGGIMGYKSQTKTKAEERLLAKEAAQRMN